MEKKLTSLQKTELAERQYEYKRGGQRLTGPKYSLAEVQQSMGIDFGWRQRVEDESSAWPTLGH